MNNTQSLTWFKSSYSGTQGGDCVEVSLDWFSSSYSGTEGGDCVEIASCPHTIHVRDSKAATGPTLHLSPTTWANFLAAEPYI
ncbi:DUF397 domain-containing protein [Streptomyces sp. SID2999]|uniref:DUF397 domain-containing protein n=1 Tax=Streptomyces sp. SID2999 TaxID=2690258 RepID=UPI00136D477E|nr:DUF397 domain-containing protein [Streptomyces sp. SID2999]MYZ06525.1 DUF397 domain-containing protein [Streptomyces sp. SID2999]